MVILRITKLLPQRINELNSDVNDFKINTLTLLELEGGERKSRLSSVLHPRALLLDFENWDLVAGKPFTPDDFSLKPFTYREALAYELEILMDMSDIPLEKKPYIKKGARISEKNRVMLFFHVAAATTSKASILMFSHKNTWSTLWTKS